MNLYISIEGGQALLVPWPKEARWPIAGDYYEHEGALYEVTEVVWQNAGGHVNCTLQLYQEVEDEDDWEIETAVGDGYVTISVGGPVWDVTYTN